MAFGKTSRKTPKTKAEVSSKTKTAAGATRTRTPKPVGEAEAKDVADLAVTKNGRKSPAVIDVDSTLPDTGATHVSIDAPMTMAAAVGSSGAGSPVPDTSVANHSTENGVAVDHAADQSSLVHANGSRKSVTREAIAERAYFYWAERGFTHGSAEEDWNRAEADLATR